MGILDKLIEQEEKRKLNKVEWDKLLTCEICKHKMKDNTFQNGSRKAGSLDCSNCGNIIIF